MIASNELNEDRETFIDRAQEYWMRLGEANSKLANSAARGGEKVAKRWADKGKLVEFLSPLLSHSSPQVQFAAASLLISSEVKDAAIFTLRKLKAEDSGVIGITAELILKDKSIPFN